MLKKLAGVSGVVLTCVVTLFASPTGGAAPAAAATGGAQIRVASFNVQSVSLDKTSGNQRPWRTRRGTMISQIMGEHPDVLGIQEANPSRTFRSRLVDGVTQYLDLRNGLNRAGGHYALTNSMAYNCRRQYTHYKCVYKNNRATWGDRILYNTDTLEVVTYGGKRYATQGTGPIPRYLSWALFRVKATGQTFLFGTTHLRAGVASVRQAQWQQLIGWLNGLEAGYGTPLVVVGDFNTENFDPLAGSMLPAMRANGYGDVLNEQYRVNYIERPRAASVENGWINSWNRLDRNMRNWSYDDKRTNNGHKIDYIFATNSLPVDDFKMVVDYDPQTLQVQGTFPSDHNMIRATLTLP